VETIFWKQEKSVMVDPTATLPLAGVFLIMELLNLEQKLLLGALLYLVTVPGNHGDHGLLVPQHVEV